jgi:TatD DNase family protein
LLSFGGTLTFRNAKRPREVAAYAPIRTDSGRNGLPLSDAGADPRQRNEPMYVRLVVEHLARIRELAFEQMALFTAQKRQTPVSERSGTNGDNMAMDVYAYDL